jgi:hypothetical protein
VSGQDRVRAARPAGADARREGGPARDRFQIPEETLTGRPSTGTGCRRCSCCSCGALALLLFASLTPKWPRGLYSVLTATTAGAALVLSLIIAFDDDGIPENGRELPRQRCADPRPDLESSSS